MFGNEGSIQFKNKTSL